MLGVTTVTACPGRLEAMFLNSYGRLCRSGDLAMNMTATDLDADGISKEAIDIRNLTQAQLMQLGMSQLAYVKPVWMDGETAFAIFAADGSPMAVAADCELAVAAIIQHEMVAASVH